MILEEK